MRSYECYVRPGPGEFTQTAVALPQAEDAVIAGRVTDGGEPAAGALALLLDQETDQLLQYTVTDGLGRFWFGPLDAGRLYALRVQRPGGQTRVVELGL